MITVHDLAPIIYPKHFKFKDYLYWRFIFPIYLKKADKIIAVSKNTKKDIIRLFHIKEAKIKVVYEAAGIKFHKITDKNKLNQIKKKYSLNRKFLFYSGSINPRKNMENVINAFECVQKNVDIDLVISGGSIWKSKKFLNKIKENKRIRYLGFLPEEDLIILYNLAEIYLYPSLYEGFGLPILEAQACGCPVITSNTSSLPEVAGKGAIYVNPKNYKELSSCISNLLRNSKLRKTIVNEGFKNTKIFSWNKCVEETISVYNEVALQ